MPAKNVYSCVVAHGSSYGGSTSPFMYASRHAARTKKNMDDAIKQFKRERGDLSWVEIEPDSIYRVD